MDWLALSGSLVAGLCCLVTVVVVGGALVVIVVRSGTEGPAR